MPYERGEVLVETHAHTAEGSLCGRLSAREVVRLAVAHGYGALVITDHNLFGSPHAAGRWAAFAQGYVRAKEAGEDAGLIVLPGMELRFVSEGDNDFLVYLPDTECFALRDLPGMSPRAFMRLAEELGMLVYQAHPFRARQFAVSPEFLHGVEVYNGNPRHDSRNTLARGFAEEHGLRMLSGSDIHQKGDVGRGGLRAPATAVASPAAFVAYLRATHCPEMITT